MLKRLGMWNRMALVAGVIFAFTLPSWIVYSDNTKTRKLLDTGFQACMANKHFVKTDERSQYEYCWDFWHKLVKPSYPGFDDWWAMVLWSAVGALFIYGLIWIVVATAKWIWRGREAGKAPSPVGATPLGNETD